MEIAPENAFQKLYSDSVDLVLQKQPKSVSDYDEILHLLDDQVSFLKEQGVKLQSQQDKEDQLISKAKEVSIQQLSEANKRHDDAENVLTKLEELMMLSSKTLVITDKLKQLESQKKAWQDGIRYCLNYQRFTE